MKENYDNYKYYIAEHNGMVKNQNRIKNYKIKEKSINFNIPLSDILSEDDIEKLKLIR